MARYSIVIKRSALKEIERYRIRQGVYRIIYSIADEQLIVHVVTVGHRRDVYRR